MEVSSFRPTHRLVFHLDNYVCAVSDQKPEWLKGLLLSEAVQLQVFLDSDTTLDP